MKSRSKMMHALLNMGGLLLRSGAEVYRVEDTLNRMGKAAGAQEMNVFVITSSIILTMKDEQGEISTQTKRIYVANENDFGRLDELNALSREFCKEPFPAEELEKRIGEIALHGQHPAGKLIGCILAAASFTIFFGGKPLDALIASVVAVMIWALQEKVAPICMNSFIFTLIASFLTGLVNCVLGKIIPGLNVDQVMIGDIMLLIPGIMMTNAIRDLMLQDILSGLLRMIEALLLAGVLALGFMGAMALMGGLV